MKDPYKIGSFSNNESWRIGTGKLSQDSFDFLATLKEKPIQALFMDANKFKYCVL